MNQKKDISFNVEIRHFQPLDLEPLAESISKNADHISEYLPEGKMYKAFTIYEYKMLLREYIKNSEPFEYFGAFYRGALIGVGVTSLGSMQFGVQIAYWVDRDFQDLGVASKLVKDISEHCFQAGYWNVEVQTDASNIGSQKVLEKNGFVMMDQYSFVPTALSETGEMLVWFKLNPHSRSPLGPRPRKPNLWNRTMILPR